MFRIAHDEAGRLRCLIVRGIVFVEEQQVPYGEEIDEHEVAAVHILGEVGGEPVAAGRLRFLDGWAKLERICVRRAWRGAGHGHQLVVFMLEEARRRGCRRFRLHAQAHLVGFYAAHGFQAAGEPFVEAGIPHRLMVRRDDGDPASP